MPQCTTEGDDDRSLAHKDRFGWMLSNMDLLYVGASVLLLVDLSYISRFWTQFEARRSLSNQFISHCYAYLLACPLLIWLLPVFTWSTGVAQHAGVHA